jgi:predicted ATPase
LDERFEIETMRLEDLPRVDVTEGGTRRGFDHLSTGQQHSVLLGLLLCADRSEPLIIDQPEDHLDAPYIASAVVRHLEAAKERRQIIIATHNANLTVLGDAELVVPLYAANGVGEVRDAGAVDHPDTLRHVCQLLEGGASAYARRGERYGFNVGAIPADLVL